eukprot:TRINITY_DN28962_c0_g3_i1.p1 TRINITY_DN28962_c0_g3~~TRINITY_DN28962_c0_g3_i1.p1  ORF type:complete len:570 (+),score=90.12 TRINITY_DN28962_c0_g3_i1:40-1749(+)
MLVGKETNVLTLIYLRRPEARQVLVGLKKRGFGAGKYNGFGGKLEPGENVDDSAVRELWEECGVRVSVDDLRWCGVMSYTYDTKPKGMEVNIYDVERWTGEPVETEEMQPVWFFHDDVPIRDMWADDEHWLLQYLDGKLALPFRGCFRFKGHEGADSSVILSHQVASFAESPAPSLGPVDFGQGAALVVSTVSFLNAPNGSARPLESFVRYHLLKGFARILLVVDSAEDAGALDAVRKFPRARVVVRVRGDALRAEQQRLCSSFAELEPLMDSDVSARQMLDAELAMQLAPGLGCSWVVCLDSDELFFTREASVVPHFAALAADGVDQMTYLNHEGVPEVMETEDYFATTTLFKLHHFSVPLSGDARACLRFWMDRSARGQYLLFYDNGKSACRTIPGAVPKSQHLWRLPEGRRSCTALADARNMKIDGYRSCRDPCILHFPICGFSWLSGKYRTLGDFPDAWLGGKVRLPESFHSDARAAFAAGPEVLEALYRKEVLLEDAAEAERQIAAGTCVRIEEHALELGAIKSSEPATVASQKVAQRQEPTSMSTGPKGIELGWILSKSMDYL